MDLPGRSEPTRKMAIGPRQSNGESIRGIGDFKRKADDQRAARQGSHSPERYRVSRLGQKQWNASRGRTRLLAVVWSPPGRGQSFPRRDRPTATTLTARVIRQAIGSAGRYAAFPSLDRRPAAPSRDRVVHRRVPAIRKRGPVRRGERRVETSRRSRELD